MALIFEFDLTANRHAKYLSLQNHMLYN